MPLLQDNDAADGTPKFDEELLRLASIAVAKEIGSDGGSTGKHSGASSSSSTVTRAQYETAAKKLAAKVDARMLQLLKSEV